MVYLGCVQHWSSTWTPGMVTELFGDLSREALPAELFNLQDTEETLEFSDSGAKLWDPLHSGMECALLSTRATAGSRLLVWVQTVVILQGTYSAHLGLMFVFTPCCLSLGMQPVLRFTGLWSRGSPDGSPVDFYSLVVLDLYKVWALISIQQSGVALLGSSQGEAKSSQERGVQGVLAQLSQLQWITW